MMNPKIVSRGPLEVHGGKVFSRVSVRCSDSDRIEWYVGELNGVRCYITPDKVILTTEDLNIAH